MKKVIKFSIEQDNSEVYEEAHKAKMGKGKLKKVVEIEFKDCHLKAKIKPKCSK